MVFASSSGQFYRDVTNSYHLSGLSHLDNFIVTRKSCPLTGTLQKLMPTLTQTATPHTTGPLGVRVGATPHTVFAREFAVTIIIRVFYWALIQSFLNLS